ncbi:MAG: hypothetical protein ACE15F_04935 [bacterium]
MNPSQIYLALAIVVLAVIAVLVLFTYKESKKITPLAGLAFGLIVVGIVWGGDSFMGYALLGIGSIMAIFEMAKIINK